MKVTISESEKKAIAPIEPTTKKRLVARWLVDRNSKIYCQWVVED